MSFSQKFASFRHYLWHGEAGIRTVHFWAPVFKWGLVIAGLSDLKKPPELVSTNQNIALAVTGFIWSRYSTQIIPKNWGLFAVNFFVGCTGLYQLVRKYNAGVLFDDKKVPVKE
ncbi:hypothetical protein C9374_008441 [Naegleria lovaniensis]|uniref:Mitochondrial pyruvate carrier n=1 Tax=Naegleria lovaniensis TaxID=51637 RepID=A0AA88KHY2_NAELO|nr:uncharacterized protein C9374_008441 [Naegleria lovaniensis]KAG2378298.1 hypothetical protein C9374_008441 [Naegleria lovaniensis]